MDPQAAKLLGAASPTTEQAEKLSAAAVTLGVMELRELLPVARRLKPSSAEGFARALTRNPALAGIQESVLRTHFQGQPHRISRSKSKPTLACKDGGKLLLESATS